MMNNFNPANSYWRIGGDQTQVWSSASASFVPMSDATLSAWLKVPGNGVTPIDTMENLIDVFATQYPAGHISTYAAAVRYTKETGGITVNGIPVATDRDSQSLITGAWATTQINPAAIVQWKGSGGAFVTLNAAAITGLASAVTSHVQACFAAEAQLATDIASGKITTTAEVDAVFSAIA